MTSRLTKTEFESRLKNLVRKGDPSIMGTPFAILTSFDFSAKPFYGEYNSFDFRITRNKTLLPNGYFIKGNFSELGSKTKLEYEIKTFIFAYYWNRFIPIIGFLFFNGILFFNLQAIQWDLILVLNGFLGLMTFFAFRLEKFQRKSIEARFIEEFEIEI
jgi:hypothetical protein